MRLGKKSGIIDPGTRRGGACSLCARGTFFFLDEGAFFPRRRAHLYLLLRRRRAGRRAFVKSKTEDPAVVVLDELGTFSVSLLSGHLGGANELAGNLARLVGAVPVITTATDRNGLFAVDLWAKEQGLRILNPERIKTVSAKLLAGETVRIKSRFPIEGTLPDGVVFAEEACDVLIGCAEEEGEALFLVPPVLVAGVGCRKNTNADEIEKALDTALNESGLRREALCLMCSADLKTEEPGILEFCRRQELPYRTFSAAQLAAAPGDFTASAFVERVTGVDNVCERAAVLGSGGGKLLTRKRAYGGVTVALSVREPLLRF
jgi:cobalt-precorrin 5A hydrolase